VASLPENGYQISCLGVERDEEHSRQISEAANNLIVQLATEFDLELGP
jgi:hypothetical protein